MLAGGAPLHAERLAARGGPADARHDPLVFYDTSSYGPRAIDAMVRVVGVEQLVYGSDRPSSTPPRSPRSARPPRTRSLSVNPARLLCDPPLEARMTDARGRDLDAASCARRAGSPPARAVVRPRRARPDAAHLRGAARATTHLAVWLICWMDDHDTGFHDHDLSRRRGRGRRAARCARSGSSLGGRPAARDVAAGASFDFGAADIHRVLHAGGEPGGHAPRLLAAAVADGRLRGLPTASCGATRSPTPRSCARSAPSDALEQRTGPLAGGWPR